MAFAAQMHAFPGGGVDARDGDLDVPWAGPDPQEWATALGSSRTQARELVCAAVRELFEECGVLLAGPDEHTVVADLSDPSWEQDRQGLLTRTIALSQLLTRRHLVLRTDLLRAWAHWTTPVFEPRRYDTRFFVAALPAGQRAQDVGGRPTGPAGSAHALRRSGSTPASSPCCLRPSSRWRSCRPFPTWRTRWRPAECSAGPCRGWWPCRVPGATAQS
jgi:8-oxo-dGTP pyrophosphatase MutT (NUDIX family)